MLCDTVNPVTVALVKSTLVFVKSTSTLSTNSIELAELPSTTEPAWSPITILPAPVVVRIMIPLLPPTSVNTFNTSDIAEPPLPVISLPFKSKLPPSCGDVSSTTSVLNVLKLTVLPPVIVKSSPANVNV